MKLYAKGALRVGGIWNTRPRWNRVCSCSVFRLQFCTVAEFSIHYNDNIKFICMVALLSLDWRMACFETIGQREIWGNILKTIVKEGRNITMNTLREISFRCWEALVYTIVTIIIIIIMIMIIMMNNDFRCDARTKLLVVPGRSFHCFSSFTFLPSNTSPGIIQLLIVNY